MARALSPSILAWLRAFDAAARLGSFTRAAHDLNVTQGAVSQQVKQLEDSLGFSLFIRLSQSLELTPEGRKIAAVLNDAFASIRDVLAEVASPGGMVPVTLSCSPSFAMRWLGPRLNRLPLRLPHIDLRVFGEFHRLDRSRMLSEGLEAAVRYDADEYSDLAAETFLDEYITAVASPAFLNSHSDSVRSHRLDGRLLLHDTRPWVGAAEDEEWMRFAAGAQISIAEIASGKRFNMSQLATDAALAGEGVAIGRLALVLEDLVEGRLVALFGAAVPAIAGYKYISLPERPPRIAAIGAWIESETIQFVQARDAFLSGSGIRRLG